MAKPVRISANASLSGPGMFKVFVERIKDSMEG